jgi:chromate transport protein ChrA
VLTVAAMLAAVLVAVSVLGDRIQAAIGDADGSMTDLITSSLGSWRNIPDIAIVSNYSAFLVPGNPAEIRVKINTSVALMSPVFAWLENTYSIFAAGGVTAGLLVTVIAFIAGMALGMKGLASSSPARISWLMMYLASWFILSKYDPSGWVVLGLLLLAPKLRRPEPEWSAPQVGEGLVPGIVET